MNDPSEGRFSHLFLLFADLGLQCKSSWKVQDRSNLWQLFQSQTRGDCSYATAPRSCRLDLLERRLKTFERWISFILICGIATIGFLSVRLLQTPRGPQDVPDTLRVRQLIVLDSEGKERIVIASPLPDPVMNGKRLRRRTVVSAGVQFKDPDGTERGGIASEEDGSFMFGIDDERGKERAHLYYIPKRGSGVYLQSDKGSETVSLLLPQGEKDRPGLQITDPSGRAIADFPRSK
jgi:hypothetical protein